VKFLGGFFNSISTIENRSIFLNKKEDKMTLNNLLYLFLSLILVLNFSGCGGGGGGDSTSANNPTITEIKLKTNRILPSEEYAILEQNLANASDEELQELNNAIDNYLDAVETHKTTSAIHAPSATRQTKDIADENIQEAKSLMNEIFGNINNDIGRTAFLNSGMGYSRKVLGGVGGSLTYAALPGGTLSIETGVGAARTYDFLNFKSYETTTSFCAGSAGAVIGLAGGTPTLNVNAMMAESWILGFKKDENYSGGPTISDGVSIGLTGMIGLGVGISGSVAAWRALDGECNFSGCNPFSPIGPTTDKYGFSMATKITFTGGASADASGNISVKGTYSCDSPALNTSDFRKIIFLKLSPTIAGFNMAASLIGDALSNISAGGTASTALPAAAIAILYGILYDEELVNNPENLIYNANGTWTITQTGSTNTCSDIIAYGDGVYHGYSLSQSGNNITISEPEGRVYTGQRIGNTITVSSSGQWFDQGYSWNEVSIMNLASDTTAVGNTEATWTNGTRTCRSNTKFTAVKDGSSSGPGTLFSDDFQDGNANGWTPDGCSSSWSVANIGGTKGYVYFGNLTPGTCLGSLNSFVPATNNYRVEADVQVITEGSGGEHGVMGRATDDQNYYLFAFHADFYQNGSIYTPQNWTVYKRVNGAWTTLATANTTGKFSAGAWYRMAMEFNGNTIRCFVDGELIWQGQDSQLQGLKFGVNAHGTPVYFDNVSVSSIN
jgi:hypothetical protein